MKSDKRAKKSQKEWDLLFSFSFIYERSLKRSRFESHFIMTVKKQIIRQNFPCDWKSNVNVGY